MIICNNLILSLTRSTVFAVGLFVVALCSATQAYAQSLLPSVIHTWTCKRAGEVCGSFNYDKEVVVNKELTYGMEGYGSKPQWVEVRLSDSWLTGDPYDWVTNVDSSGTAHFNGLDLSFSGDMTVVVGEAMHVDTDGKVNNQPKETTISGPIHNLSFLSDLSKHVELRNAKGNSKLYWIKTIKLSGTWTVHRSATILPQTIHLPALDLGVIIKAFPDSTQTIHFNASGASDPEVKEVRTCGLKTAQDVISFGTFPSSDLSKNLSVKSEIEVACSAPLEGLTPDQGYIIDSLSLEHKNAPLDFKLDPTRYIPMKMGDKYNGLYVEVKKDNSPLILNTPQANTLNNMIVHKDNSSPGNVMVDQISSYAHSQKINLEWLLHQDPSVPLLAGDFRNALVVKFTYR